MRDPFRWLLGLAVLAVAGGTWFAATRLGKLDIIQGHIGRLDEQVSKLRADVHAAIAEQAVVTTRLGKLETIEGHIGRLDDQLSKLYTDVNAAIAKQVGGYKAVVTARLEKLDTIEDHIGRLDDQLSKLHTDVNAAIAKQVGGYQAVVTTRLGKLDTIEGHIGRLDEQVSKLGTDVHAAIAVARGNEPEPPIPDMPLRTVKDVKNRIEKLNSGCRADRLAETLAELDTWNVRPEDEKIFLDLKLQLAARLRKKVKAEVLALQKEALETAKGAQGALKHAEAGRVLSLYPMSQDKAVLDEAMKLSAQQVEVAVRIEVLRRQRYNRWAAEQIEKALNDYNANSSYWSPKKENPKLIDALVRNLGEVDPSLIEPAVLGLYNHVVDRTKSSISEKDKTDLAKRLTDPSIQRKTLGDF